MIRLVFNVERVQARVQSIGCDKKGSEREEVVGKYLVVVIFRGFVVSLPCIVFKEYPAI
jgi:hypothetical protein